MRDLKKNQVKFEYRLLLEHSLSEEEETYTDKDGNTYTILDGTEDVEYGEKIEFKANFQESGRNVAFQPFGLDVSQYDLIVNTTQTLPITETSLIYRDDKEYKVVKISRSLNQTKYILRENNK